MRPNEYNDLLKKIKCSDDFRSRMQQKLSAAPVDTAEYEDSVSGTEVITSRHSWGRIAALAAAFVLVCGAAGGGAYHLARINNKTKEGTNISETEENASIYSVLKANKDLYSGDMILIADTDAKFRRTCLDIEPFINYMDQFDMYSEVDQEDFIESGREITINFYEKEKDKELEEKIKDSIGEDGFVRYEYQIKHYDDARFTFKLYDNGCFSMTENDNGDERTTYHCFADGEKVFNDILEMYADENTLERIHTVTDKELENEINNGFNNSTYDRVYYYPAGETDGINYKIVDREGFANELRQYSWERVYEFDGDVSYYYLGFIITDNGYMQFEGKTFRLKEGTDLESFKNVLAKHLQPNDHWTNASEDVFDNIINEVNKSRESYNTLSGTFSMGFQGGSVNYVVDGTLKYDRVNDELYFYSEGSENGYENAVDHTVVEEAKTGGKMIMSRGSYCYESDSNSPRESKIFCDNVYDEVEEWLESRKLSENKYNIEKNTFDNGYTTYAIGSIDENKKDDIDIMNFVLDEKGRLISVNKAVLYSIGDEAHDIRSRTFFTLNEFEFDPSDFDGSDIPDKYNEMKQRLGDELNKWS